VQRRGTGFIGSIFGPVMLVWFAVTGLLALAETVREPAVLAALDPRHALGYLLHAGSAIGLLFGILVHAGEIQNASGGSDEGLSAKCANPALFD
jgi:KUP system potassium uptake protein